MSQTAIEQMQAALDASTLSVARQRSAEARARGLRRQEIARITAAHPLAPNTAVLDRVTAKHRAMAALIAFGELGEAEANRGLGVASVYIGFGTYAKIWGLEHIGQALITQGLPVLVERRLDGNGREEC